MQAAMTVELSSPVSGIVESVDAERSQLVEKGQVVARLESDLEQVAVRLASEKAGFDGDIEARRASYAYAKRRRESMAEMYGKKAVTFQAKDEADTEAAVAKMELQEARHRKRLAELELEQARNALEQRTIRSPVTGVVVERLVSPGEFVDEAPLMKIAQLDPLHVEAIVPLAYAGSIRPGTPVEVLPETMAGAAYSAQVTLVDPVIDAASGTFGIRIDLPNPDNAIMGGLRCTVSLPGQ